jgi:hypothetical protein
MILDDLKNFLLKSPINRRDTESAEETQREEMRRGGGFLLYSSLCVPSAKQICKFLFFEQDFIVYAHQSNPHLFLMSSGIGCQRTKAPLNRAYYCSWHQPLGVAVIGAQLRQCGSRLCNRFFDYIYSDQAWVLEEPLRTLRLCAFARNFHRSA